MSTAIEANQISEYVSTIKDLSESTNDLAKAMKYVSEFGKLSKLTAGLGMVGAGFAIIGVLSGEEDATDKVLNAIDKLSNQVTELGNRMDSQFSRMESVIKEAAAKAQLVPAISFFDGLKLHIDGLSKELDRSSTAAIQYRKSIRTFSVADITKYAETIVLTMTTNPYSNSVLDSVYVDTHGDITTLNDIAGGLMSYLLFTAQAHGIVLSLGSNDEEMKRYPSDIESVNSGIVDKAHNSGFEKAQNAWQVIINKCISSMSDNVESKTKSLIDVAPNIEDHSGTVTYLLNSLSKQFFWNDWIVIVYNPVTGFDKHAMFGSDYKPIFRYKGVNVVVKWIDKGESTINRGASRENRINCKNPLPGMMFPDPAGSEIIPGQDFVFIKSESIEQMANLYMLTPLQSPGFIWTCNRQEGVFANWTNPDRVIWENGLLTFCLFE